MGMLDISIVKKYIRMADDGWHQGWHERNGSLPELRTIQDDELRTIARDFKVQLREDFLD